MTLIAYAWADAGCCLPDDAATLAKLSGLGDQWEASKEAILSEFRPDPEREGYIFHVESREQRNLQLERRAVASERAAKNGRAGGLAKARTAAESSAPPLEKPASKPLAKPSMGTPLDDEAWIADLKKDPAYAGVDVGLELARMKRWCLENRKSVSRRRAVNWLNRADRPLLLPDGQPAVRQPPNARNAGIAGVEEYGKRVAELAARRKAATE